MNGCIACKKKEWTNDHILKRYMLFWSLLLLAAAPLGCVVSGEGLEIFENLYRILTSPANLITDYYNLGGLGSTLLNVGLAGLSCNLMVHFSKTPANSKILAGYFLVIAHGFYGLNILNMWPPFFGVLLFCRVTRKSFSENLHLGMFSTSLAPFISDFLFRYTLGDAYVPGEVKLTVFAVVLALLFGLLTGFVVPALMPGMRQTHRGYSLYKAGLAIGLLGTFIYAFFYTTLGFDAPSVIVRDNALYEEKALVYDLFVFGMFLVLFLSSIYFGWRLNGKSFRGYRSLFRSTGYKVDFAERYGMPLCLMNIGIYGLFILLYLNLIFLFTTGVSYTGPTTGVVIAALTFSARGQTPRNVFPVTLGYIALYGVMAAIVAIAGLDMPWTLSSQGYINGLAFATGLCPIAGRYGWHIGMIAGFVNAIICTSTSAMHGGFVLYNGGFAAGLTAMILLPILEFYKIKIKYDDQLPALIPTREESDK